MEMKSHWEKIYDKEDITKLGWYQDVPEPSLKLIRGLGLRKDERIVIAGAGATTLVDHLLHEGHTNITACDISGKALGHLGRRLGNLADRVEFVVDDLTHPENLKGTARLWHDRAVLHFLLGEQDRRNYHATMDRILEKGGHALIATFSKDGAARCSGLDVRRYDAGDLQDFMGDGYRLVRSFSHLYTMPNGDTRPYTYTLFQKL